jgi:monoamine oxidase
MDEADVAIVGAGAAGLAAARDLAGSGLRVVVLEARERTGGLIETLRLPDSPLPIELGAEFVHDAAPETLRIADAARLTALDIPDVHWRCTGGAFESRDFWGVIARVLSRVSGRGDRSAAEFLDSRLRLAAADRALVRSYVEGYHAAPLEGISARSIALEPGDDRSASRQLRILEGQDRLIAWLADGCDPDTTSIRTATAAARVDWTARGVRVTDATGRVIRAEAAVVTAPIGVLQAAAGARGAIRFAPELPAATRRAIRRLAMGAVVKVVLRFREPFWERDGFLARRLRGSKVPDDGTGIVFLHDADARFSTWWTAAPARAPFLTGWAGGPAAAVIRAGGTPPAAAAVDSLARLLAMRRGEIESRLASAHTRDWTADPWSRGAYSYARPGGAAASRALAQPVGGRLFFAGEATAGDQTGTVAGAIASGRRAAGQVRAALGGRGRNSGSRRARSSGRRR